MKTLCRALTRAGRQQPGSPAALVCSAVSFFCCIILLTGCASLSGKFTPKKTADVDLFAENTMVMLSQLDLGFDKHEAVYLSEYVDLNGKEEHAYMDGEGFVRDHFNKIIRYSLKLVVIDEEHAEEADRVAAYVDYVAGFHEDLIESMGLHHLAHDSIIEEIKAQDQYMLAIQKAHPIIKLLSQSLLDALDQMDGGVAALEKKYRRNIMEEYKPVIQYQEVLEEEKYDLLYGFENVYRIFKGDTDAYHELRQSGVVRDQKLISMRLPSDDQLEAINVYLRGRMAAIRLLEQQIEPDWANYRETLRELDRVFVSISNRINQARMLMLLWLRSHQKMASGIANPAEWYNINELPDSIISKGTKAIF